MSRRKSISTPLPRSVGPLAPNATASSGVIRATPLVRISQIGLSVRRFSYSSTFSGKYPAKSRTRSKNPNGGSSAIPPTRKYDVIIRCPLTISNNFRISSRSRKQYKKTVMAPRSSACVPSHTRCELMRVNSFSRTRNHCALGGISSPSNFSTAST